MRRRAILLKLLAGLALLGVFSAASVGALLLHLNLPSSRRVVATELTRALNATFEGSVNIGRIDRVGLTGLRGSDIWVRDPRGREVLRVTELRATADLYQLLTTVLATDRPLVVNIEHAHATSAQGFWYDDGTGLPSIVGAFTPRSSPPSPSPSAPRPVRVEIRNVELSSGTIQGAPTGLPKLAARVRQVRGALTVDDVGVDLRLRRFGLVLRGVPNADVRGIGSVQIAPDGSVQASFDGDVADVQVASTARLLDGELTGQIELPKVTAAAIRKLLPEWPVDRDTSAHVEVAGRLPELRLHGKLESGRTEVVVLGPLRFSPKFAAELAVQAERVDLSAFSASAPTSSLDLSARLDISVDATGISLRSAGATGPSSIGSEGVPPTKFTADYERGELHARAEVSEPGARTEIELRRAANGAMDLVADARALDLTAPRLSRYTLGRGVLTGRLRAHAEDGRVQANIDATLQKFERSGLTAQQLEASGTLSGKLDALPELALTARVKGKELRWAGMSFPIANAKLSGSISAPNIAVSLTDWRGAQIELAARLRRTEQTLLLNDGKFDVLYNDARLSGRVARVELRDDVIVVDSFQLEGLAGSLIGSAEVRPALFALSAEGKNLDVGGIARVLGLPTRAARGKLELSADVILARDIERGTVSLTLEQGSVGPVADLSGKLHAELRDRQLQAEVQVGWSGIAQLAGQFALELDRSARDPEALLKAIGKVDLALTDVDLGLFSHALSQDAETPLSGKLAARVLLERSNPDALPDVKLLASSAGLRVMPKAFGVDQPQLSGMDLEIGASVAGATGASEVSFKVVDAHGDLLSGSLTARLALERMLSGGSDALTEVLSTPVLGKFLIEDRNTRDFPEPLVPVDFSARVRAEVNWFGTLRHPLLAGKLRLAELEWASQLAPRALDVCLNFGWEQQSLRFGSGGEVFLRKPGRSDCEGQRVAHYSVNGSVTRASADAPARAQGTAAASLERLPLEVLPGLADAGITGEMTGTLSLSGENAVPVLSANLEFENARVQDAAVGRGKIEIRSNERSVGATLDVTQAQGGLHATVLAGLDTSGSFPKLSTNDVLGVRISAQRADAALLLPLARDLVNEIGGQVDAELTLAIPLGEGEELAQRAGLRGEFALHDGFVQLAALNAKLRKVELAAVAEPDGKETRIRFSKLDARGAQDRQSVRVHDGVLWLRGFEISRAEARVDANALPLVLEGVPQAIATTRQSIALTVQRTPDEMQARLRIPNLLVALPQAIGRDLIPLDENKAIVIKQPLAEPLRNLGEGLPWRFRFELGNDVKLTRSDLDIPLSGKLDLLLADPMQLNGQIELEPGGRVDVSGKTFVVDSGEIYFDTGEAGNPRLNLVARWRAPDGSPVTAQLTGTVKKPQLTLSSPSRSREETLAMLLGNSGRAQTVGSQATNAVVGADQLLAPLLANTPLRKVSIRTGSEVSADRRSYSTVTAGLPITDTIWFEAAYKTLNTAEANAQRDAWSGTVDWRFRRNWSLRTEVGKIGTGVDLSWNYRY